MSFSAEQCHSMAKSSPISSFLPTNIENLCECFDQSKPQSEKTCKCDEFSSNDDLMSAVEELQKCKGDVTNFNGGMISNLQMITQGCYKDTLNKIVESLGNDEVCNVDMSKLKESGKKMVTLMNTVGSTVNGAFELLEKVKKIFYNSKSFFAKLIQNFPGSTILYPVGVVVFILMVVIGIFYSIIKIFRCIFCRSSKKNKGDYSAEQMKQLQEQYSRTLQTNSYLNNYLIGYQNV
ncbi:hypothetical protein POVCU2_0090080 [Plasmodium ovale curtisi]|uniref:Uncharacterized protein n=1 Tax=Plasmodium ovale curtisi TaxID=864141 RepID=A0A1A8WQY5_PLAOA|nr:hypothetical protein POVCU2_0090080 [Plasmodium ovale curtisi]